MSTFVSKRPTPLPFIDIWSTNLIRLPLLVVVTAICGSISLLISFVDRGGQLQQQMSRIWARLLVALSGARLEVYGLEKLASKQAVVFASNHTSYMDTPVVFSTLPCQFRILAKQELWRIPFIGWYLGRSGQIPVDTEHTHDALRSLAVGVQALRHGMPLFVFPEGRRTPDGELQPFLAGAAYLAIRAQVPLVPIALVDVYDLLPIHTRHFFPCKISLRVGTPISTTGFTLRQVDALNAQLKEAIQQLLNEESSQALLL